MSVKVDLDRLADTLGDFPFGYLLTVDDGYRTHVVSVVPSYVDGAIDVGSVGRRTRSNLEQREDVTLVFPPREPGGYTLIVDGRARGDEHIHIAPSHAVLHRNAAAQAPTDGCGQDCVELD